MNEPFHANLKLITGEELLAEVFVTEECGEEMMVLGNPIVITESTQIIDHKKGIAKSGLLPKKWLTYSNDDMVLVNKSHVITISELDKFAVEFYQRALIAARLSSPVKRKIESSDNSGYVGDTKTYRDKLENMYNNSFDVPE